MGLDVRFYSDLVYLDPQPVTEDEKYEAQDSAYVVQLYNPVGFNRLYPQLEGYYQAEGICEWGYSGGYGRYSYWRELLAKLAGWPESSYERYGTVWPSHANSAWEAKGGPFWELINFSDCEGAIGSEVSKKLLDDFLVHEEGIKAQVAKLEDGEATYFLARYQIWKHTFEVASQGGAVRFC